MEKWRGVSFRLVSSSGVEWFASLFVLGLLALFYIGLKHRGRSERK
jgi:hypothetical protein